MNVRRKILLTISLVVALVIFCMPPAILQSGSRTYIGHNVTSLINIMTWDVAQIHWAALVLEIGVLVTVTSIAYLWAGD